MHGSFLFFTHPSSFTPPPSIHASSWQVCSLASLFSASCARGTRSCLETCFERKYIEVGGSSSLCDNISGIDTVPARQFPLATTAPKTAAISFWLPFLHALQVHAGSHRVEGEVSHNSRQCSSASTVSGSRMQSDPRAVVSRRMGHKARALAALLLLVFARLATAAHSTASQAGDDLPPMNPPVVLQDDPNTPITYEWPSLGPWPLSDDEKALAKAFAADEAAYELSDYPDEYDYSLDPILSTGMDEGIVGHVLP